MMRKTITRTFTTSTIKGYCLAKVDGKPVVEELAPVTVFGKVNEKQAVKALTDHYGKGKAITLDCIEYADDLYEISVDDFMKHAKKVEKETLKN